MAVAPRAKQIPSDKAAARLQAATEARAVAEADFRLAILEALDSGGSVREVADLAKVSTRSIQDWSNKRS